MKRSFSQEARVGPMRALLMEDLPEVQREEVWTLSATQLRDRLIALRPLDSAWIARVNQVWHQPHACATHSTPWLESEIGCLAASGVC